MARAVTFKASYKGIGQMLTSSEMQAAMRQLAEKVKARAEANAPVGNPSEDPHAGRYKSSFYTTTGVQHRKTSRAYAEIGNTAPEALFVEYGDSGNGAAHVLLDALSAVHE
jgi:outer membrane receptor for Fe3+-dicitrate